MDWWDTIARARRLVALASRTGMTPRVLDAISRVESSGRPSRLRFEPHLYLAERPDLRMEIPYTPCGRVQRLVDEGRCPAWPDGMWSLVRRETDADAFDRAARLDAAAAVRATSWGAYQVMGEYLMAEARDRGWPDHVGPVQEDAIARYGIALFAADPAAVSEALMIRWIMDHPDALEAARKRDWRRFAAAYNGRANTAIYGPRLARAYRASTMPDVLPA